MKRLFLAALMLLLSHQSVGAQLSYTKGQNISPGYEGWEENEDGSFNLLFGYMNRNWLEELDVPVGPDNMFSPGPADQGQPTHFLPRRNRFIFRVHVPADFGDKEMVWKLTTAGRTEYAYASLRTDYRVDNMVIASETGALGAGTTSPESRMNVPPVLRIIGDTELTARVGQPLTLVAEITDDGLPEPRRRFTPTPDSAAAADSTAEEEQVGLRLPEAALRPPSRIVPGKRNGLHLSWFVYRGTDQVAFDPIQIKVWEDTRAGSNSPWAPLWSPPEVPEDAVWEVQVTFAQPGTYVLRARADDGALFDDQDVTVTVTSLLP